MSAVCESIPKGNPVAILLTASHLCSFSRLRQPKNGWRMCSYIDNLYTHIRNGRCMQEFSVLSSRLHTSQFLDVQNLIDPKYRKTTNSQPSRQSVSGSAMVTAFYCMY